VDIASAGSAAIDIGGLEIAKWWQWPFISARLEAGFASAGDDLALEGGGAEGQSGFLARTRDGQIGMLDLAVSAVTGLDFQKLKGLTKPFVFVEDADTAAHWPRDCFLAVNADLPPMVAQLYDRDAFQFRLREFTR
jgi:hypothetical protein